MPLTDVAPIEASIEIAAPPAQVWELVSDLSNMSRWSPQVFKTFVRGGETRQGAKMININRKGLLVWPTQAMVTSSSRSRRSPSGSARTGRSGPSPSAPPPTAAPASCSAARRPRASPTSRCGSPRPSSAASTTSLPTWQGHEPDPGPDQGRRRARRRCRKRRLTQRVSDPHRRRAQPSASCSSSSDSVLASSFSRAQAKVTPASVGTTIPSAVWCPTTSTVSPRWRSAISSNCAAVPRHHLGAGLAVLEARVQRPGVPLLADGLDAAVVEGLAEQRPDVDLAQRLAGGHADPEPGGHDLRGLHGARGVAAPDGRDPASLQACRRARGPGHDPRTSASRLRRRTSPRRRRPSHDGRRRASPGSAGRTRSQSEQTRPDALSPP